MIRWSHDESAGHFWWPAEFENVANSDFGNLKHMQNPGHLLLTASSTHMKIAGLSWYGNVNSSKDYDIILINFFKISGLLL